MRISGFMGMQMQPVEDNGNFPYDGENSGDFEAGPNSRHCYSGQQWDQQRELEGRDEDTREMWKGQGRLRTTSTENTYPEFLG